MSLFNCSTRVRLVLAGLSGFGANHLVMLSEELQNVVGAPFGWYCSEMYTCPFLHFWDWLLVGTSFGLLVMVPCIRTVNWIFARAIGLILASIFIYFLAEYLGFWLLWEWDDPSEIKIAMGTGMVGALGALLVATATRFLAPLDSKIVLWLCAGVAGFVGGATLGPLFDARIPVAYFSWQVLVCVALNYDRWNREQVDK